ncbi:MAG: hypothetical protein ACYC4R_14465 [Anaerolineae bacterium]
MITAELVEALIAGLASNDDACEVYPDLDALRACAQVRGVPLQWALCTTNLTCARGVLRHSATALLSLLDALDEAETAGAQDGCPLWHALAEAPPWLLAPNEPDDDEPDIALLMARDEQYGGEWNALIEALHEAGSRTWQWAIARCRAMQAYETRHACNLRDLLRPAPTPPEGEGLDLGLFWTANPPIPEGPEEDAWKDSPPTD